MKRDIPPVHPGEILREDFLKPMGITQYRLAKDINVPVTRVAAIMKGKRRITADTALRLSKYFGTTPEVWMNLQSSYDLECAKDEVLDAIEESVKPYRGVCA